MASITYTVKSGDSLWKICAGKTNADASVISGNTINAKINTLVELNSIPNPNLIRVGQILTLSGTASGTTSSSSTQSSTAPPNHVVITEFGLKADSESGRDVVAIWNWHKHGDNLEKYELQWEWDYPNASMPNGYETKYTTTDVTDTWASFSIPEEFPEKTTFAQVFITPIAKQMKDKDGKDIGPYWTADRIGATYRFAENPPKTPNKPTCKIEDTTLTMEIANIPNKLDASYIVFQVVKDNTSAIYTSPKIPIVAVTDDYGKVSHTYTVSLGSNYTVRAKSVGANGKESGWTEFSEEAATKPSAPTLIEDSCRRVKRVEDNSQAAHLEWTAVPNATYYEIEYTNIKADFDNGTGNFTPKSTEDDRTTIDIVFSNDQLGKEFFFRVRAVNDDIKDSDNKKSEPSNIVSIPVGSIPDAPSTWSTSDSAFSGDTTYRTDEDGNKYVDYTPMELNWVHMPTDNSKQSLAELWIKVGDNDAVSYTLTNTTDADTTGERIDEKIYGYGTAVSYKGNMYFKMDTNAFTNAKIQWKVRTAGITDTVSDDKWSAPRTIYIYEKPTLELSVTKAMDGTGGIVETLTGFPFYVRGTLSLTDYTIQRPVGYHLRIVSNDYYVTVDDIGRTKTVNPGDAVYSKYFDTSFDSFVDVSNALLVEMSANNIDLESGMRYTIYCNADMSTGLAVGNQHDFTVSWVDVEYAINADISINNDAYTALITPYCLERVPVGPGGKNLINIDAMTNSVLTSDGDGIYTITHINTTDRLSEIFDIHIPANTAIVISHTEIARTTESVLLLRLYMADGTSVYIGLDKPSITRTYTQDVMRAQLYTMTNENDGTYVQFRDFQIELGSEATEYEEYYETYEDGNLVNNVTLAVYRREYDGSYKEIASGIPNNKTSVTDPHPALDYARYRFTAKDQVTGALSFWDMAGYPVKGSAVIIQWDEEWSTFDVGESTVIEGPSWSGSLLRLPYNIKISDKRKRDKTLVKYAGREYPVSYYGTQINETSQWNVDIPAYDKETIYALRRLSMWSGNVYVREPSGMGFWANIEVSFNKSYNDVKIPITLSVTRVEGGV